MNFKKVLIYTYGPMLAGVISTVTLPFIAWLYSEDNVGRFSLLNTYVALGTIICSLGLHQSYVRFYHEEKNSSELLKVVITPVIIVFVVLSFLTLLFGSKVVYLLFSYSNGLVVLLFLVSVFLSVINNIFLHMIRMEERAHIFSVSKIINRVSLLLSIFLFYYFFGSNHFLTLLVCLALSQAATSLFYTISSWHHVANFKESRYNKNLQNEVLRFGLPLVVGSLAYWGIISIDKILLSRLSGLNELALYSVASSFAALGAVAAGIFSNLWHPTVYRWAKEGAAEQKIGVLINNIAAVLILLWCVVGAFSWLVPLVLPDSYGSISPLITACLALPILYILSDTTVVGLGIKKMTVTITLITVVCLLVNSALNFILIPSLGARGAAISSVISIILLFTLRTEVSRAYWTKFPVYRVYFSILYVGSLTCFIVYMSIEDSVFISAVWGASILLFSFVFSQNYINMIRQVVSRSV